MMTKQLTIHILLGLMLSCGLLSAAESEFSSATIHVGVVVKNLEKSLNFYTKVIGMTHAQSPSFDIDEKFAKASGLSNGVPFHVEVLKLKQGEETTQYKLMSFGDVSKANDSQFIQDQAGIQYLTLFVTDLRPFLKRIKAHGIPMLGETPVKLSKGKQFVLIQDPDGTFIELIGPKKPLPER